MLDTQTVADLKVLIKQEFDKNSEDFGVFEDWWHALVRPDYPVKKLRRLDINIFDGEKFGIHPRTTRLPKGYNPNDTGLQCVVYIVDDNLDIDYDNPMRLEIQEKRDASVYTL